MKNKEKLSIIVLFLFVIAIFVVLYMNFDRQRRQNPLGVSYEEYIKDDALSLTIEKFGEDNFARYNGEKSLCAAKTLWEKDIDSNHKIVSSSIFCMEFVVKDDQLKADDGYIVSKMLFVLENKDNTWQVADYDDRNSEEAPAKSWVTQYLPQVPPDIDNKIDEQFVWGKLMQKASKTLNITTGEHAYKSCSYDSDCDSGNVCFLHNFGWKEAANKCVKKCSNQQECGVGYVCRKRCIHGEGQCDLGSENVCFPFLEMEAQGFTVPNEPF